MMKALVFLLCVFVGVMNQGNDGMVPFVSPILSVYPCKDETDIMVWFEPAREPKDNNRYYVYANKAFPQDCKVRVIFDSPVNITFIVRTNNNEYSRMTLQQGDTFTLHFFMAYAGLGFIVQGIEAREIPYLISFSINEAEYCNYPTVGFLEQYASQSTVTDLSVCGRRKMDQKELIVSAAPTKPGDWPWHAAIYKFDRTIIKYICGGTLISKKFVLTAAHCASLRGKKYQPEIFTVVLGKYTLTGEDKDAEEKDVLEVILHEHYDYRRLINDIALFKLKTDVVFNDFIQPACLFHDKEHKKLNTDEILGTIVGWGFDNNDQLSQTMQQATMPIVSEATCLKSNALFYSHALNDNTFCAGHHNGTSACNGDSGSAFQVFVPDEMEESSTKTSGTWHVKGIVSNTLSRNDAAICDPNQYVIFTDVEKYIDWINSNIEK